MLRGELGERVVLLEADAVEIDYGEILRVHGGTAPPMPAHPERSAAAGGAESKGTAKLAVVGNLPYHLTSPILFSLLDQAPRIARAVFLLQREVAERLAAAPGTHEWGILSVLLQREAEVSIERIVPRGAFLPPPKVESAVLVALFRPPADEVRDEGRFRRLVKAGFAQRRKTLANALRGRTHRRAGATRGRVRARGGGPGPARRDPHRRGVGGPRARDRRPLTFTGAHPLALPAHAHRSSGRP